VTLTILHIFKGTVLLLPQIVRHCSAGTEICVGQAEWRLDKSAQ